MRFSTILVLLLICVELNSIGQSNIAQSKTIKQRALLIDSLNNRLDSTIIGTWISDEDNKWRLTFTNDNKCQQYYDNILSEADTVIMSNSSPQCGITVDVDTYTNYLQLKNIADTLDNQCYLINGITNTSLSISIIDQGGAMVFTKQ
jgi:hypothetical protein